MRALWENHKSFVNAAFFAMLDIYNSVESDLMH